MAIALSSLTVIFSSDFSSLCSFFFVSSAISSSCNPEIE
jgi:hypothetical protein